MNKELSFYLKGTMNKAILLIHGLTGAPGEMKYLAKQFHKQGFTVYAPLLAGHGKNVDALVNTTWEDWYESVEDAYDKLKQESDEIYVAGICAGGSLGLQLAAKNPEIAGVAVYSITFNHDGWDMPKFYSLSPLLPFLCKLPFLRNARFAETETYGIKNERLRKLVVSGALKIEGALDYFPIKALNQMYRLSINTKKILRNVISPTLLIHSKIDDQSHARNPEYIIKHIKAPCRMEWLQDSYHMIHVDQERKKVADLTSDFFEADKIIDQERQYA